MYVTAPSKPVYSLPATITASTPALVHRGPHIRVPALDLLTRHHADDASSPLTSAQIAAFSGVGTPCSRPKRTMPPFR